MKLSNLTDKIIDPLVDNCRPQQAPTGKEYASIVDFFVFIQ